MARSVGIYDFVGEHYLEFQERHPVDPATNFGVPFASKTDAYVAGDPIDVPAWLLSGWSARAAGVDVLPRNRRMRARTYRVFGDDHVEPVAGDTGRS